MEEEQNLVQMVLNGETLEYPKGTGEMVPKPEGEPEESEAAKPPHAEKEPDPDPRITALETKIQDLEKSNQGLLGKGVAETKARQAVEARLSQMTDFLARLKANSEATSEQAEVQPALKFKGFKVEMTEDGEAYVPDEIIQEHVNRIVKEHLKPIESSIKNVTNRTAFDDSRTATTTALNQVLSENEAFPVAYKSVNEAWNELVRMTANQYDGKLPPPKADPWINAVIGTPVEQAFKAKYPALDVSDLILAYGSDNPKIWATKMRGLLTVSVSRETTPKGEGKNEKGIPKEVKELASKPNNLAGARGATGPAPTDLNRIADMDFDDFNKAMRDPRFKKEADDLLRSMA
jgi:hypothetical protein